MNLPPQGLTSLDTGPEPQDPGCSRPDQCSYLLGTWLALQPASSCSVQSQSQSHARPGSCLQSTGLSASYTDPEQLSARLWLL